jgi:hypothetical protein
MAKLDLWPGSKSAAAAAYSKSKQRQAIEEVSLAASLSCVLT